MSLWPAGACLIPSREAPEGLRDTKGEAVTCKDSEAKASVSKACRGAVV